MDTTSGRQIRPGRTTLLALILLLFTGFACQKRPDVSQTETGRLVLGEFSAERVLKRGVRLEGRTLELIGGRGTISLDGTGIDEASLTFTKRIRGNNEQAAHKTLQGIRIDETGNEAVYHIAVHTERPEVSSVDVHGTVPPATSLNLQIQSGEVALSGIEKSISVKSESGDIRIAGTHSNVNVEVQNGTIEVGLLELPANATVRLHTTNGNITLTVPSEVATQVNAQTEAGTIHVEGLSFSDRKLNTQGAGAHFTGRLGQGNAGIDLQTENGSIILKEGRVLALTPADSLQTIDAPKIDSLETDSTETTPPDALSAPAEHSRLPPDSSEVHRSVESLY